MTTDPCNSWFVGPARSAHAGQSSAGLAAEHQAIERICAGVAPSWARVRSVPLLMGGTAIWTERVVNPAAQDARQSWIALHQMSHELGMIGWRTVVDPRTLLVLGWSTEQLWDRASLLQLALTHGLADLERTVARAIRIATAVLAEHPARSITDVAVETGRRIAVLLRWPARLAALDGLERVATQRTQQLALMEITGLEATVAARCEEHLAVARLVAMRLCEHLQQGVDERLARHEVLIWAVAQIAAGMRESQPADGEAEPWVRADPPARPRGRMERLIAASIPNHPIASELPPDRTMSTGPLHAL